MVLEAETVGILEAFLWTEELPANVIRVESDSMLSVNAINKAGLNYMMSLSNADSFLRIGLGR